MEKNKKKFKNGFTVIELVVVIAIIAVLATIVSANVINYIDKSKNAAIKSNMTNLFTSGVDYYVNNGNYNGFCQNSGTNVYLTEINRLANPDVVTCRCESGSNCSNAEAWCTVVKLKGSLSSAGNYFCLDSTGNKMESSSSPSLSCSGGYCH